MIIERDGIKIEEFATLPSGSKHYQVTRKTASFTHISILQFVVSASQNEVDLLKLAKRRLQCP